MVIGYVYNSYLYVPFSLFLVVVFVLYGMRMKAPLQYYLCALVGVIYINIIVKLCFFPITFWRLEGYTIYNNMTWSLFDFDQGVFHYFLNILLTIPLGMGMQFVTNMSNKSRFGLIMLLSISIELIELIILFIFKPIDIFFDIKDLMANVIGGLLGYFFIFGINKVCGTTLRDKQKGIMGYINAVCYNCTNGRKSLDFNR